MSQTSLIEVGSYIYLFEAQIAKTYLEEHQIQAFLENHEFIATDWSVSVALGGVRVKVQRKHAKKAYRLLREWEEKQTKEDDFDWGEVNPEWANDVRENPPDPVHGCPECGCTDLLYEALDKKMALVSLLFLGIPLPFLSRTWTCDRCGHKWKDSLLWGKKPPSKAMLTYKNEEDGSKNQG